MKGRVVIVTGGGSGIGREICLLLARKGAKVVVADVNYEDALQTVSIMQDNGETSQAVAIRCDVSRTSDVENMIESAVEKFDRIDAAVNNAGLFGTYSKIADYPEEEFDNLVRVNLKGVFLCMKYELSQMMKQSKANHYAIVNVSSFSGIRGTRANSPYAATKHAVLGLTRSAALEYARSGVRINAVCPSQVVTPMITRYTPEDSPEVKKIANGIPMHRLGKPEEVAAAIFWLLSDESSFTTGHALSLDGGLSCL